MYKMAAVNCETDEESDIENARALDLESSSSMLESLAHYFDVTVPRPDSPVKIHYDLLKENDCLTIFSMQKFSKKRKRSFTDGILSSTPVLHAQIDSSPLSLSLSTISIKCNEATSVFGLQQCTRFVNSEEIQNYSTFSPAMNFYDSNLLYDFTEPSASNEESSSVQVDVVKHNKCKFIDNEKILKRRASF